MTPELFIEYAAMVCRIAFGIWNIFFGLVFFGFFIEQPMGHGKMTPYLNQTLIDTGLFHIVKAIEIVVGVMLVLNIGTPLALVVYAPITVVIFHVNMFLEETPFLGPFVAVVYLVVHLFLLWAYRSYYSDMLVWDSSITQGISLL